MSAPEGARCSRAGDRGSGRGGRGRLELRGRRHPCGSGSSAARSAPGRRRRRCPPRPSSGNGRTFVSPVVARIAVRARRRPEHGAGHRDGRPRDEEGHPRVRRGAAARPQPAAAARTAARASPRPHRASRSPHRPQPAPARCARRLRPRLWLRRRPPRAAQPPPAAPAPAPPAAVATEAQPGETFEPMTAMRKGIAEHMRRSLDTSAHVTSAIEVDMSRVVAIRAKLKKEYEEAYGVNPTYLSFVARADRRDAARVPVDQRRDPRRQDRDAELRQPRLRGRARRRQGADRPGREAHRGPEPARDGARGRRDRQARPREEADARRRPGRHVHDHEPGRLRHVPRHAGDQPAAGRRSSAPTRS